MAQFLDSFRSGGAGFGAYTLRPTVASQIPVTIKGVASQTANLLDVRNSADTLLFSVEPDGDVTVAGSITASVNEVITGNIDLTGTLTVAGATTLNGNVILGDIQTDSLTVNAISTFKSQVTLNTDLIGNIIQLQEQGVDPANGANLGKLYSKDVSGITELFYIDSSSNTTQITNGGAETVTGPATSTDNAIARWNGTGGNSIQDSIVIIGDNAAGSNIIDVAAPIVTTGNIIDVGDADSLTTGRILNLISNSSSISTRDLVVITNDNTLATGARCLVVQQDAVQTGVLIDMNANGAALRIESTATTSGVVSVPDPGTTTGISFDVAAVDALTTGSGLRVYANGTNTSSRNIVNFVNDNTLATGATVLRVQQDSTGLGINCTGPVTIAPAVVASATQNSALLVTGAAHTALTLSTEAIDVSLALARTVEFATGALTLQRAVNITAPTYGFVGASTLTDAVTFSVAGSPVVGTNATITRRWTATFGTLEATVITPTGGIGVFNTGQSVIIARDTTNNVEGGILAGTDRVTMGAFTSNTVFIVTNNIARVSYANSDFTMTPGIGTSYHMLFTGPADTGITASTEAVSVDWDCDATRQWATGALTLQREMLIRGPTYGFVGASTLTTAVTFTVNASPAAGTNAIITNSYAAQFGGTVNLGATSAGQTYAGLDIPTHTVTVTGTTQVTSVGFSGARIGIVTVTDASAVTVDNSASLYITDAPVAAGLVTLTNPYSIWVDAGLVRLDGGVAFAGSGQSTLSNYTEGTFTPTVTLVGGAGNTVPVYSTNTGRHTRIGRQVFVEVYLTGDGGAEGAGTGVFNVNLPITASASNPTSYFPVGIFVNGTAEDPVWGQIVASGTTIELAYEDVLNNLTSMTGAEQNNTTRTVRLKFFYEV